MTTTTISRPPFTTTSSSNTTIYYYDDDVHHHHQQRRSLAAITSVQDIVRCQNLFQEVNEVSRSEWYREGCADNKCYTGLVASLLMVLIVFGTVLLHVACKKYNIIKRTKRFAWYLYVLFASCFCSCFRGGGSSSSSNNNNNTPTSPSLLQQPEESSSPSLFSRLKRTFTLAAQAGMEELNRSNSAKSEGAFSSGSSAELAAAFARDFKLVSAADEEGGEEEGRKEEGDNNDTKKEETTASTRHGNKKKQVRFISSDTKTPSSKSEEQVPTTTSASSGVGSRARDALIRQRSGHSQTAVEKYGLTDKKTSPLDVRFNHLGLVHKGSGKHILTNLTGRFLAGELGAVIGPSGCGKSSFLSVLAGIAHWGHQTGVTYVNGIPDQLKNHRSRVGFVPQDDVVFPTLTVRENLLYQALLRMPVSAASDESAIFGSFVNPGARNYTQELPKHNAQGYIRRLSVSSSSKSAAGGAASLSDSDDEEEDAAAAATSVPGVINAAADDDDTSSVIGDPAAASPIPMPNRKRAVDLIQHVMQMLQIDIVADAQIGGYGIGGGVGGALLGRGGGKAKKKHQQLRVSGGQRKRVSIGFELCCDPSMLLADEPTSGLDATVAHDLLVTMEDISRNLHINVVTVIHQPRYSIFCLFDTVCLLGKGGRLVYFGPADRALSYFELYLGFPCPPNVNPPDYFLDVISGEVPRPGDRDFVPSDLAPLWRLFHKDLMRQSETRGDDLCKGCMALPSSTDASSAKINDESFLSVQDALNSFWVAQQSCISNQDDRLSACGMPQAAINDAQGDGNKQMRPAVLALVRDAVIRTGLLDVTTTDDDDDGTVHGRESRDAARRKPWTVRVTWPLSRGYSKGDKLGMTSNEIADPEENNNSGGDVEMGSSTLSTTAPTPDDRSKSSCGEGEGGPLPPGVDAKDVFTAALHDLGYKPARGEVARMGRFYVQQYEATKVQACSQATTQANALARNHPISVLLSPKTVYEMRVRCAVRTIASANEWVAKKRFRKIVNVIRMQNRAAKMAGLTSREGRGDAGRGDAAAATTIAREDSARRDYINSPSPNVATTVRGGDCDQSATTTKTTKTPTAAPPEDSPKPNFKALMAAAAFRNKSRSALLLRELSASLKIAGDESAENLEETSSSSPKALPSSERSVSLWYRRQLPNHRPGIDSPRAGAAIAKLRRKKILTQVLHHIERAMVLDVRNTLMRSGVVFLFAATSAVLGLIFQRPTNAAVPALFLMAHLSWSLLTTIFVIFTFGAEKAQVNREVRQGVSIIAYWLGRNVLIMFDDLLYALVASSILAAICRLDISYSKLLGSTYSLLYFASGFGQLFSAMFGSTESAVVVSCVLVLIVGGVLSGANPPLAELQATVPYLFNKNYGLPMLSFARWSVELASVCEWFARPNQSPDELETYMQFYSYDVSMLYVAYLWLWGVGTFLRGCALIKMRITAFA